MAVAQISQIYLIIIIIMWFRVGTLVSPFKSRKIIGCSVFRYFKVCRRSFSVSKNILYAQPTSESHPHLLKRGEVTHCLTTDVFKYRRKKLLQMVKQSCKSKEENIFAHLIIIPSSCVVYMSENIPYPFRQFTDFFYLCGYKEANSVLVLASSVDRKDESILFVPKPTVVSERWEGAKLSLSETTKFLGVDKTEYIEKFDEFLQSYAKMNTAFTVWFDFSNSFPRLIQETVRSFIQAYVGYVSLHSPRSYIHECRLQKCKHERVLMQKTCRIAAEAMREVIKFSKPSVLESHLQAKMEYECRIRGADHPAFPPVTAGGCRANTIHYIDNNQVIKDKEMVLMDAGCEYNGYCSDLARTWPVNGKFTDPQRELYDLILSIQEYLIERCTEKLSLDYLFKIMCNRLGKGLQNLGIISKSLSDESLAKIAYEYCPHHVSHYLGMDVHDTDTVSRGINLLPGMVVTVEPGVYISSNDTKVPEKYRGICIRIEDDVLITENGIEVLTSSCPKHPEDIEKLIQQ